MSALFSTNILVDNVEATWWNSSWDYYRTVTLDSSKIDTNLDNFPVLVVISDAIGDKCDGGNSLRFVAGSNSGETENVTEYNFEIEKWVDGSNRIVWVNVTEVYSGSDTVFNMYYNNSGASDGQDVAGTWDSNYIGVYHLSNYSDSTSYNNDGTAQGDPSLNSSGAIGSCYTFDGTGDYIDINTIEDDISGWPLTLQAWSTLKSDSTLSIVNTMPAAYAFLFRRDAAAAGIEADSFYASINNGANYYYDTGADSYDINTGWRFGAFSIASGSQAVYINATAGETGTETGSLATNADVDVKCTIGVVTSINPVDYWGHWVGEIDEVRVSTTNRNASWLKADFHTANQSTGFLTFGSEQQAPAGATVPTVTTNDATGVEENNATIRGTLTNNGSADTTCYFIWGDETPPTDHNDSQGIVAHEASFSKDCTSLSEGTLYYFYTKANNSEGWDVEGAGGIKSFFTKPDPSTGASADSSSSGSSWINLSWTAGAGADRYYVRYSDTATPTTRSEGTELCNVTTTYYNSTFSTSGTYYFSIWSYASEVSPALHQWSDTYSSASEALSIYTWHSESFGGKLTVTLAIDVEINDSSWIAGSLDCGDDVQKNFTFYQNGSATIDITIGINSTNGNYSFVNYTTWSSNGHDQYCANFTVDTWSSESMIEPDYPASSVLKSSFAPGNFVYGIRLWMPKSVTYQDRQEDFEVVLYVSEST